MANPSIVTPSSASAAVDEVVRIAAESSRRSTESAQAALLTTHHYVDQASTINRQLFSLWSTTAQAAMQTTFDLQNAALANSQTLLESSVSVSQDSARRWAEVARQVQTTTLQSYQTGLKLLETFSSGN